MVAWIMKSQTYQADAITRPQRPPTTSPNFSHTAVRLLPAEVLLDAITQVLDVPERFRRTPRSLRAAQSPGVGPDVPFLKTFGKPERSADLRVRAIRRDHPGPGVPDDQRRDFAAQAGAKR